MTDKRNFIKTAMTSAIPALFAAPLMAATNDSDNKLLARLMADIQKLKSLGQIVTWEWAPTSIKITERTFVDWQDATITLPPGRWQIFVNINYALGTSAGVGHDSVFDCYLNSGSTTLIGKQARVFTPVAASTFMTSVMAFSYIADLATQTAFKITVQKRDILGTGTLTLYNQAGTSATSDFYAVRIG